MPAYRIDCSIEAAESHGAEYLKRWLALPRCPDCDRPTRPHKGSPQDWPATVVRAGGGYCSTHYAERRSKNTLPGDRKVDYPPATGSEKQQVAATWSAEERSAALLICDVTVRADIPFADNVPVATELLDMLGLLDPDRNGYAYDLNDPKGAAAGRY
ncbi:hypothetical protein SEA_RIE18_83 [Microbacterium phage Rie18]|nr:hypothetical protein SEA_RIE18_83 [Microbacterium phage Rie18]